MIHSVHIRTKEAIQNKNIALYRRPIKNRKWHRAYYLTESRHWVRLSKQGLEMLSSTLLLRLHLPLYSTEDCFQILLIHMSAFEIAFYYEYERQMKIINVVKGRCRVCDIRRTNSMAQYICYSSATLNNIYQTLYCKTCCKLWLSHN